ncbi:unnamed protein product [Pleuronectes platessa]|uniref:Uncharacterized protein n=1 Tax=Pleuronectes platessa TaxID=8262 RepID=A0A9N7VPI7_PLEPL|nr:unnamed protein product [Pleuronectes platessa]
MWTKASSCCKCQEFTLPPRLSQPQTDRRMEGGSEGGREEAAEKKRSSQINLLSSRGTLFKVDSGWTTLGGDTGVPWGEVRPGPGGQIIQEKKASLTWVCGQYVGVTSLPAEGTFPVLLTGSDQPFPQFQTLLVFHTCSRRLEFSTQWKPMKRLRPLSRSSSQCLTTEQLKMDVSANPDWDSDTRPNTSL